MRFTIRELLLATAIVGLACAGWLEQHRLSGVAFAERDYPFRLAKAA